MVGEDEIMGVPISQISLYEELQHQRFQSLVNKEMAKHYYDKIREMEIRIPNIKEALKEYNRQWDEFLSQLRQ